MNAQFVSYVTYKIKSIDTCVAKTLFAFIHAHTNSRTPLHSFCVCSGPGFGSDISEMVGTRASSVNEMGKVRLTPDRDPTEKPVSKTA